MESQKGKFIQLRKVITADASFILSLRCAPHKSRFLHPTEDSIEMQIAYIENCLKKNDEYYFIIEDLQHRSIGTYRIYDLKPDSFGIGSWLMVDGASTQEVMEADFLVRKFGFETLGFDKCHFDVRKKNTKVVNYHKIMGAVQVAESNLDYFFECTKSNYYENMRKFLY